MRVNPKEWNEFLRVTDAASLARDGNRESVLLFIYGSLMRGLELHQYMSGATFIGEGHVRGTLVSLGRYPGMIEGTRDVRGEVYELDDAAQLEALDDLEAYDPERPEVSEYVRAERDVVLDDGRRCRAWTYLYNRDVSGLPDVASGDWRKRDGGAARS